jgi:hypothetical protein
MDENDFQGQLPIVEPIRAKETRLAFGRSGYALSDNQKAAHYSQL